MVKYFHVKCFCLFVESNQTICSLKQYLKCVIPNEHESSMSCNCPDACNQTDYDVQLSHSTLSGSAINTLLFGTKEKVQKDFHTTMELLHRVREEKFINIVLKIKKISMEILHFKSFLGTNTDFIMQIIRSGLSEMRKMIHSDAKDFFNQIEDQRLIFQNYLKPERKTLLDSFKQITSSLQQFAVGLKWKKPCTMEIDNDAWHYPEILKQNLKNFNATLASYLKSFRCESGNTDTVPSLAVFQDYACQGQTWAIDMMMPHKSVGDNVSYSRCKIFHTDDWPLIERDTNRNLENLLGLLSNDNADDSQSEASAQNNTKINKKSLLNEMPFAYKNKLNCEEILYAATVDIFYNISKQFQSLAEMLTSCLFDYEHFLAETSTMMEYANAPFADTEILDIAPFDISPLDGITKWLSVLYQRYRSTDYSKLNLADALLNESQLGSLSYLEDLVATYSNRFEQDIIASIRERLRDMEAKFKLHYDSLIDDYIQFSDYFRHRIKSNHFRKLTIFRRPRLSLEDANLMNYRLSEKQIERIIGSNLITFLKEKAHSQVSGSVQGYFAGLDDIMNNFHRNFADVKGNLATSVTDLKEALAAYKQSLTLGSKFIE